MTGKNKQNSNARVSEYKKSCYVVRLKKGQKKLHQKIVLENVILVYFYHIYHHPPQRWTVFSLPFVMFLLSRGSIRRINVWFSFNLLFSSYFNEICSTAHKIIVMVNWLFKISYTPVGPETYSSGLFMHKIPLCEALSKCVMTGLSPEVFLQSLSAWLPLQAVLQLLFLTKLWSGLLQCRNADTAFILNNESHSAATYEIKVLPVWKRAVVNSLLYPARS